MGKFACRPMAEKLVNLKIWKFACQPLVEKLVNLPVGLWRRNYSICLSAFGGEIIQFENYSIWKLVNLEMGKWGNLPVGLWRRNGEIWKDEDCGLKIQYGKTLHKSLLFS